MRTSLFMNLNKPLSMAMACLAIMLGAPTANALTISAEFDLANSSIANPVTVFDANTISVDLTPGDVLALNVVVSNPSADLVTAIFTSLIYDPTVLTFLGGAFGDILTEDSCIGFLCSPATMTSVPATPGSKPNSPFSQLPGGTEDWIQAVAHTNITGAMGTGPDSAVLLAFQYTGIGGADLVSIVSGMTPGDAVAGEVVGPINFTGASIVIPEPGTTLLLGLGLLGLGVIGRQEDLLP